MMKSKGKMIKIGKIVTKANHGGFLVCGTG